MRLLALLEQLQLQKEGILLEVGSWPSERIQYRPSQHEWSAIEVLDHLVRTEIEILASARKGLLKPHRIHVIDWLRTRFVQAVFRSDRKVKVPSSVTQVLPSSNLELPEIVQRWNKGRQELCDLVKAVPEAELKKGIFRHPVGGWMGMPDILNFFSVHIVHHHHQLARLQSAILNVSLAR